MIDAINSGLAGLLSATKKVESAANNIANLTTPVAEGQDEVNLSEEAVNLILAETEYKANLATIKTASELSDDLFRIFDEDA